MDCRRVCREQRHWVYVYCRLTVGLEVLVLSFTASYLIAGIVAVIIVAETASSDQSASRRLRIWRVSR
jgi:hypothetical protein